MQISITVDTTDDGYATVTRAIMAGRALAVQLLQDGGSRGKAIKDGAEVRVVVARDEAIAPTRDTPEVIAMRDAAWSRIPDLGNAIEERLRMIALTAGDDLHDDELGINVVLHALRVYAAERGAREDALRAERDEARDWVRRLTGAGRVLTCAFCREAYPPNMPEYNHDALTAHVKVCAKHPMREVEAQRDEWREWAHRIHDELGCGIRGNTDEDIRREAISDARELRALASRQTVHVSREAIGRVAHAAAPRACTWENLFASVRERYMQQAEAVRRAAGHPCGSALPGERLSAAERLRMAEEHYLRTHGWREAHPGMQNGPWSPPNSADLWDFRFAVAEQRRCDASDCPPSLTPHDEVRASFAASYPLASAEYVEAVAKGDDAQVLAAALSAYANMTDSAIVSRQGATLETRHLDVLCRRWLTRAGAR